MRQRQAHLLTAASLFMGSLLIFLWGLRSQEIVGFDSRFYLFALEMWRHGATWFPTIYHEPYPDYPAASIWLIYACAKLAGGLDKLTAVLPSALAASLTIMLTYLIGAMREWRWGLYAALLLLLTVTFLSSARSISLDMYVTLFTTASFYMVCKADHHQQPLCNICVWFLWLLGFACRGPIGLIMPAAVVGVYYLIRFDIKKMLITAVMSLLLLVVCVGLFLGLAYHVGGEAFVQDVWRMEVMGRVSSHYLPVYFYLVDGMVNYAWSLPLAFLVLFGVFYYGVIKKKQLPEMRMLLPVIGWLLIILAGMSIAGEKKIRYILASIPAAALIAAYPFAVKLDERYFVLLRQLMTRIFLYFPLLLLLAVEFVYFSAGRRSIALPISYLTVTMILLALQIAALAFVFRNLNKSEITRTVVLFAASLSFVVTYLGVVEPIELYIDKARDFVHAVEVQRLQRDARLVFYKEGEDGLPIKYVAHMSEEEQPVFIDNAADLMSFGEPAVIVTSLEYFEALPHSVKKSFMIIASDRLGHTPVVVFVKK